MQVYKAAMLTIAILNEVPSVVVFNILYICNCQYISELIPQDLLKMNRVIIQK